MAVEKLNQATASEEVREMIEFRRKAEHDEATRLESARLDGIEEGLEKGERHARCEMSRKLLASGMDARMIQEITGIDVNDLKDRSEEG